MTDEQIIEEFDLFLKYSAPERLLNDVLELINRQKAEIDRLKEEAAKVHKIIPKIIETAKVEAVKEFAEKLCEDRVSNDPIVIAVKCLLKEKVGDNDEN